MTMTTYNGDIKQSLKWMESNAPRIQSLVQQKADWYENFQYQFWQNWEQNVFNLKTANPFGIRVWCEILGVPSSLFGLYLGNETSWAYGQDRQNFVYSGTLPAPSDANVLGGNFFGGGETTIVSLKEARWALMLRYAALVSNGRVSFINRMLAWIFNEGKWTAAQFSAKKYFYLMDSTGVPATGVAPVSSDMVMEYRVGANLGLSEQLFNIMNSPQYGIMPTCAGVSYTVIKEL